MARHANAYPPLVFLPFTSDAETLARLPWPPRARSRSGSADDTKTIHLAHQSIRSHIDTTYHDRYHEGPRKQRNRVYNSDLKSLSHDARRHPTAFPISDILDLARLLIRTSARGLYISTTTTTTTTTTSCPIPASTIFDLPVDQ
jgi:hypothetical protein